MRRFLFLLLRRAFAWPACLPMRLLPRFVAPRDRAALPAPAACRRAWGAIRARYRLKHLAVPA